MSSQLGAWSREATTYLRASRGPRDFVDVMRVRLSQSKVGRWVAPRPLTVDVDLRGLGSGVRLRSHTSDIDVLGELLVGDSYVHLPTDGAPPVRTVIDLGANVGLAFRWLQQRYPNARFVCVEPDPGNVAVLEANARHSGADAKVIAACIGAHERKVVLTTETGEYGFHMEDVADQDAGDIDVITMAHLLDAHDIGDIEILKCDIEGAEEELFADCADWIGRVHWIVAEVHGDYRASDLEAALAANGARFERVFLEENRAFDCETVTLRRVAA